MDKLTEHQFHTVWTTAVGEKGYDKRFFQALFEKLFESGLIGKPETESEWKSKWQTAVRQKINLQNEIDRLKNKYEPQKGVVNDSSKNA